MNDEKKRRGLDESEYPAKSHPCFPYVGEGEDERKIYFVRVKRRFGDGEENAPRSFPVEELPDWEAIVGKFGGGTYKLIGLSPGHRFTAETPWTHFEGESKPMLPGAKVAAALPRPTVVTPEAPRVERANDVVLEMMRAQNQMLTTLLQGALQNKQDPLAVIQLMHKLVPSADPIATLQKFLELQDRFGGGGGAEKSDGGFEGQLLQFAKMLKDGSEQSKKEDDVDVTVEGLGSVKVSKSQLEATKIANKKTKQIAKELADTRKELDALKAAVSRSGGPSGNAHSGQSSWSFSNGRWWCWHGGQWWVWDGQSVTPYNATGHHSGRVAEVLHNRDSVEESEDEEEDEDDSGEGPVSEVRREEASPKEIAKEPEKKPVNSNAPTLGFDMGSLQDLLKDPEAQAFLGKVLGGSS